MEIPVSKTGEKSALAIAVERGMPVPDTLGNHLRILAQRYGTRIAVIDGGVTSSYAQLDTRASHLAISLMRLGIRPKDHVMVQMPNGTGFIIVCFALFRLGAVPVMAMPGQSAKDINELCQIVEPVAYFVGDGRRGDDRRAVAQEMIASHPSLQHVIIDGDNEGFPGFVSLDSLYVRSYEPVESWVAPDPGDIALLLLSGGTTGTPKLIPHSHARYLLTCMASSLLCNMNEDSVYLAVLPMAHNFTLACPGILGTLSCGGRIVIPGTASCDTTMPLIEHQGVTHVALVPALAKLWLEARQWEKSDLSSLKLIQVGGARLDVRLAKELPHVLGGHLQLQQVYGMAEGFLCYTRPDDPDDIVFYTQGRPLLSLDEIRIVDEFDNMVSPGEEGELLTRGPYMFSGYYQLPEQNSESFTIDGFYRTGDLVRLDKSGNLVVVGRVKEQINRSGEKISAAEIENQLVRIEGINEAVVVAVPDPVLGERICAFFLARPGVEFNPLSIRRQLQALKLTSYKIPDQYETIPDWPLTPLGKIDKKRLVSLAGKKR